MLTRTRRVATAGLLGLGVATATPDPARADLIRLRGGGEIRGVVVDDAARPGSVEIQTATGSRPLSFARDQILSVVSQPGPLDEYLAGKDRVEATAQAQYDFGLWCEEAGLSGPAQVHFRKAVALDPQFGPAHKKLGHVQQGDRWLTYDEQREAQGLVKIKGKWISRAEKDKIDTLAALSAEQASWSSRLKLIRRKLYGDDPDQRRQAEAQLAEIRDPAAVPGLVRAFSADSDAVRIRLAQLLGAIPGPEAAGAIVGMIVAEADPDVRSAILDELTRRHDPESTGRLIAFLKAGDPSAVGRAAWALAATRSATAVPRLVDALIQSEKRTVMVPVASGTPRPGSYGFSQNFGGGAYSPAGSSPGFSYVSSLPVVTGAAVAPGAVAFGAGSVPFLVGSDPAANFPPEPGRAFPSRVTVHFQNYEVLKALESLTGVNYGFDRNAWRRWIGTSFHPDDVPARRVPQP